jgi:hypothetical protein
MTRKEMIRERDEVEIALKECSSRFDSQCVVKETLSEEQKLAALEKMQAYLSQSFAWE